MFLAGPSSSQPGHADDGRYRGCTGGDGMGSRNVQDRRADARRNIAANLDAATTCLIRDPQVSTSAIARAAGVGRVTL
jgi:TetR/AcrR family transcriptional repressor of mexCD-oprJ operon